MCRTPHVTLVFNICQKKDLGNYKLDNLSLALGNMSSWKPFPGKRKKKISGEN